VPASGVDVIAQRLGFAEWSNTSPVVELDQNDRALPVLPPLHRAVVRHCAVAGCEELSNNTSEFSPPIPENEPRYRTFLVSKFKRSPIQGAIGY